MRTHRDRSQPAPHATIRLVGAEPAGAQPCVTMNGGADYDALADLFLADGALAPQPIALDAPPARSHPVLAPTPTATKTRIEGLILGHLPVLGAAWITQYARHVADSSRQGVALLRLQAGQVWLDLIPASGLSQATPEAPSLSGGNLSVEAAIATAAGWTTQWIIRVDEPFESDLLKNNVLSGTTLLTGADDTAVVASYRMIKSLGPDEAPDQESGADTQTDAGELPTMKLAIMGADDQKAAAAEQKLLRAVRSFLGREVEPAARIRKIGPCPTVALLRTRSSLGVNELLSLIHAAPPPAIAAASPAIQRPGPAPSPIEAPTPVRITASQTRTADTTAAPRAAAGIVQLATHLPGLSPLNAACPYAPGVQLAANAEGELHMLIASGTVLSVETLSVGDAVKLLLTGASWAQDHAALLADAYPVLRRSEAGPALHLLTDDPRAARGLIDTGVRLHFLAAVEVDGRTAWVCRDLN